MHSLLDTALADPASPRGPRKVPPVPENLHITRTDVFLTLMQEVAAEHMAEPEVVVGWREAKHRSKVCVAKFTVANLVKGGENHGVTEATWRHMVQKAIEGMKKGLDTRQGNGDWRVSSVECALRRSRQGYDLLLIACEWTDALGERDLRYENGRPMNDPELRAPELVAALGRQTSGDPELHAMFKQLIAAMLMREGASPAKVFGSDEPAATAPLAKRGPGRPRKDAEAPKPQVGQRMGVVFQDYEETPEPVDPSLPPAEAVFEETPPPATPVRRMPNLDKPKP